MNKTDIGVAVFETHSQAELAVKLLHRSGFDMKLISILGKEYLPEENTVYSEKIDRIQFFGKLNILGSGLTRILSGSAQLFIPVVGYICVLGPLASMLVGAGEINDVSALFGILGGISIPDDSLLHYETLLNANRFLLLVHGDVEAFKEAHDIFMARPTRQSINASSARRQQSIRYDREVIKCSSFTYLNSSGHTLN